MSLESEATIAMEMIFSQFQRLDTVTFYKSASEVVVSEDANWNADFSNPYATNITKTAQKKEINCRIIWNPKPELLKFLDAEENLNVRASIPLGEVTIQVQPDDFGWLKDATSFWIKNNKYTKASDWEAIGMLGGINVYQIQLKKDT